MPISLFVLAGYLAADLGTLWVRGSMLPTQPPPARPKQPNFGANFASYQNIVSRNIFNSDGKIPDPLAAKGGQHQELPPIPSQLPLNLSGTLVHSNPEKSLAALEIRGKNQILSYRPGQRIENLATLEKVERMKIFLRNLNTGRLEFIEMKNAPKIALKTAAPTQTGDVKKVSETEFEIKRADLLKYTNDLSSILMQARVVPAKRGGTGEIYGYRLVEMQPGSIYTQLGLNVMDVITCVNGTAVTSPQQAMEMYTTLRNSGQVEICIERGGRNQNLKYNIR
ncbi:MAG: general secretion pathway protein GspC [Bdellovibrionaceae bacterium]|nr:general secretion pathway protein GspC [Pseudobdellovibrionaceae bacterium]MBX3033483.1 general secretion pathway protein GspC [Pseudobdellovibrionaceae bacterium]